MRENILAHFKYKNMISWAPYLYSGSSTNSDDSSSMTGDELKKF